MSGYFLRTLASHLKRDLIFYLLTVAGSALGVAAVLAVQIINWNATGVFQATVETLSGDSDLGVYGVTPYFPEEVFPEVLAAEGVAHAQPTLRTRAVSEGPPKVSLEIIGLDIWTAGRAGWKGVDAPDWSSTEPWIMLTPSLASELKLGKGSHLTVTYGSLRRKLRIAGLVQLQELQGRSNSRIGFMDIAHAQDVFGLQGQISSIEVWTLDRSRREGVAASLRKVLGDSVLVSSTDERSDEAAQLLEAFRVNLTALSLISFAVGLFLIYTSVQAALLRRRREFGVLRSLGVTRKQLLGLLLGEASILGIAGTAIGIPVGHWAAKSRLESVSSMLSNVYLLERIEALEISPWIWILAAATGLAGAVAGSLFPALEITRRPPRLLLLETPAHEAALHHTSKLAWAGTVLLLGSGATYWLGNLKWKEAGVIFATSLLLALPLLVPKVVQFVAGRVPVCNFGWSLSLRNLGSRLLISSFAVASLSMAICMLIGITVMVGSFRKTVGAWVQQTVSADIYISPESWRGTNPASAMDAETVLRLTSHPGIEAVDRLRKFPLRLHGKPVWLSGIDIPVEEKSSRFPLLEGSRAAIRNAPSQDIVLVSEPLARRRNLNVGDFLLLPTARGLHPFQVVAIFYDYASESGSIVMDLSTLERHYGPGDINSMALYLREGFSVDRILEELRDRSGGLPLSIRSQRELREGALHLFDQTFAVVRLLQVFSLLIALVGAVLTLLIQARERLKELALYGALGAERRQIFQLFFGEAMAMSGLALVLGSAGGAALAAILIFGVNRAYFGWTIQVAVPWSHLAQIVVLVLAASAAAAFYPARRAGLTSAAELSRDDT